MPRPGRPHNKPPTLPPGPDADSCRRRGEIHDLFQMLSRDHMLGVLHSFIHNGDETLRFKDLQARLDLSPNTLSTRLKELVAGGFLERTAYNQIPPRVDYQATQKAKDLCHVFRALHEWAAEHDDAPAEEEAVAVAA